MSWTLERAYRAVLNGTGFPAATYHARAHCIWHRVALPDTGGAGGSPGRLTFFNQNKQTNVTNIPQGGRLPGNYMFGLQKIGIYIEQGRTLTGAGSAAHVVFQQATAAPAEGALTAAEVIRLLYTHGNVNMKVGNRNIVEDVFGVHNFPWGSVPAAHCAAVEDTNTTAYRAAMQAGVTGNQTSDGWWFDVPQDIYPDKQIEFTIDWTQLLLDTFSDLVVRVGLFGQLVSHTSR